MEPAFGADDGRSRHVSRWLVAIITKLFIETFSKEPGQDAGSSPQVAANQ